MCKVSRGCPITTTTKRETVSIFILLIKANPLVFLNFSISSNSLENNKNRIRKSGNP